MLIHAISVRDSAQVSPYEALVSNDDVTDRNDVSGFKAEYITLYTVQ